MDAEAIKLIISFLEKHAPKYVPAMPSIKFGIALALIVLTLGVLVATVLRYHFRKSDNLFELYAWVPVVCASIFLTLYVYQFAFDRHYHANSIALNRDHFAAVHWLGQYVRACQQLS